MFTTNVGNTDRVIRIILGIVLLVVWYLAPGHGLRWLPLALGIVALVALDIVVFGKSTFIYLWLGPGGIERWVSYPVILWQVAFGAYLLGSGGTVSLRHPRDTESPVEP